jgi:oxygen-independent coproporphyrinogen-3 oxidase
LRDGFGLADFHSRFGRNFECIFGRTATPLFNDGLMTLEEGRIKLTDRGLEMADSVFAEFV